MAEELSIDQFFEFVNRRDLNMLEKLLSEDANSVFRRPSRLWEENKSFGSLRSSFANTRSWSFRFSEK